MKRDVFTYGTHSGGLGIENSEVDNTKVRGGV